MTLECAANQSALAWEVNGLQLLDELSIQQVQDAGFILGVGALQSFPEGNRITITIPATIKVNNSINTILCKAGPTEFDLSDGDSITFTVYGQWLCDAEVSVCVLLL